MSQNRRIVAVSQVECRNIRSIGFEQYSLNILAISTANGLIFDFPGLFIVDVVSPGREKERRPGVFAAIGGRFAERFEVIFSVVGQGAEILDRDALPGSVAARGGQQACKTDAQENAFRNFMSDK